MTITRKGAYRMTRLYAVAKCLETHEIAEGTYSTTSSTSQVYSNPASDYSLHRLVTMY